MNTFFSFLLIIIGLLVLSRHVDNNSHMRKLNFLNMRSFGIKDSHKYLKMQKDLLQKQKEKLRQELLLQEREEEKRRNILNERLMPLTKGNGYMKDFYSGRY